MAAGHGAAGDEREYGVRLRLLQSAEGLGATDLLRLALQQAVAALGGFGGFAHLQGVEQDTLRLAAANGIPTPLVLPWEELPSTAEAAPARAVARRRVVWSSQGPPRGEGDGADRGPAVPGSPTAPAPGDGLPGGGVVSAPLLLDDAPVGALSVLTVAEPDEGGRRFLARLAECVGARLPRTRRWRSGTTPWWQEPIGVREQVMQQISVGTWSWDLDSGLVDVDDVAEGLIPAAGLHTDTWDHRIESWMERIHPDDRPGVQEAIESSLATGHPYAVEYRVIGDGGAISWLELRAAFEHDGAGRPVRMVGTAWNVTARRSKLAWLVGLLELHPDPIHVFAADDRVEWANQSARGLGAGAGAAVVGQVPWEVDPKLAGQGLPELLARARAAPGAAASAEMMYLEEGPTRQVYWLIRAVEVGGFVATQMADITEQKMAELAAAETSHRMTEFNEALIRAADTSDVVAAITEYILPLVHAEGLIVHDLTGPSPQLVGDAGHSVQYRAEIQSPGWPERLAAATRTAAPQFIPSLHALDQTWPLLTPLARHGGNGAWAVLPLIVGDRRVGSCIISWPAPRVFGERDKTLLGTVAVIIAQALGKARLYEEARHRAKRLQQELLPGVLPRAVAVNTAARYRPAAGQEVGGDWYDTIPLPGGRTLAVIGDVKGHGLEQAIAMGILRHAVLAVAALDLPVDEILAHLNDAVRRVIPGDPLTATCLLVLYDATTGACQIAGAAHPPPIVLPPGGKAHEIDIHAGSPLGKAQVQAPVTDTVLDDGSVLVLYSDGLLGAGTPAAPLTAVVSRYAATAPLPADPRRRGLWLDSLCNTITEELPPDPRRQDDAALLTLSAGRVPEDSVASWDLPWAPESAGNGRILAAERIAAWGLSDLTETATLIVSELIGNAVRHAVGIGTGVADDVAGLLRLRLLNLGDGTVTCEVYDGSQATPRVRHPLLDDEFGRGLQLVAVTGEHWGTRYTEGGKCIWATIAPP
jgi:GAF domain-containing protein